jgi:hypothetical protein
MYIAVQITRDDCSIWLPLPATKAKFADALEKIGAYDRHDFSIERYAVKVPKLSQQMLLQTPLSVVNHLASRLNKLSDDEMVKLCAICDTDYYFDSVGKLIDYTYQTDSYTLLPGICDLTELGEYYLGKSNQIIADARLKKCIDRREFGRNLAESEKGAFTPHGYLSSKIGWELPSTTGRPVPDSLLLKGYLGEELYGDWGDYDIGA